MSTIANQWDNYLIWDWWKVYRLPFGDTVVEDSFLVDEGVPVNVFYCGGHKPKGRTSSGGNNVADGANLVSPERANHILYGESPTPGGHMYPGNSGKSVFPESWDARKILNAISDIATDPALGWTPQTGNSGFYTRAGNPSRFWTSGVKDGNSIKVIVEPAGEGIITGFPWSQ